jgi:hypothetical protein
MTTPAFSSWAKDNNVWKSGKVLKKLFKKTADVTHHFNLRLFQRFDVVERRNIVRELHFMLSTGMYPALFEQGQEHATVVLNNRYTLAVTMKDNRLVLKTIYDPEAF